MQIGLNLLFYREIKTTGTGTYARNLVREFVESDSNNNYYIFARDDQPWRDITGNDRRFKIQKLFFPRNMQILRIMMEQVILPFVSKGFPLDVIHSLCNVGPLFSTIPSVVTVHGLDYKAVRNTFSRSRLAYYETMIPLSAHRATMILTDSEFTYQDVSHTLGIPAERIRRVHLAVDPGFARIANSLLPTDIERVRAKYGILDPYFLVLGALTPHRNLENLLQAFRLLVDQGETRYRLVLAGGRHDQTIRSLPTLIDKYNLRAYAKYIGWIPFAELPALYRGAAGYVLPSLFEGFGFPALEAMVSGTPVLSSNRCSLPEVVGQAGLLFDPLDIDSMASAMHRIIVDTNLRAELIFLGYQQAKQFSWSKTAQETLDCYSQAVTRIH
jgi:glycosyltransferase involved in cell wall biosynthesis